MTVTDYSSDLKNVRRRLTYTQKERNRNERQTKKQKKDYEKLQKKQDEKLEKLSKKILATEYQSLDGVLATNYTESRKLGCLLQDDFYDLHKDFCAYKKKSRSKVNGNDSDLPCLKEQFKKFRNYTNNIDAYYKLVAQVVGKSKKFFKDIEYEGRHRLRNIVFHFLNKGEASN